MTAEYLAQAARAVHLPVAADLPPMHRPAVRVLSRAATTLGRSTLTHGAMVNLAQEGASQVIVSLAGATRYLAAVRFGMQGGIVAASVAKRTALVFGDGAQAALCLTVPAFLGTVLAALLPLLFGTSMLGQIVAPATKASVVLVATGVEVAAVAAILSVAAGLGSAVGSSFLAPLLVTFGGIQLVMYVSGAVLALGAIRTVKLPGEPSGVSIQTALRALDWKRTLPSFRSTTRWILATRTIATMTLVGAAVVAPVRLLRLLELFGITLSAGILAAGLFAIPFSCGSTAAPAVQPYLNRQVPITTRGSVFGMQETLENLLTLFAILTFGLIATVIGPRIVFLFAPPIVTAGVVWLIRESDRAAHVAAPSRQEVIDSIYAQSIARRDVDVNCGRQRAAF